MTAPRIVVVGLGPGDPDLVTAGTLAVIEAVPHRFLRTEVHPSAHLVRGAATCNDTFRRVLEECGFTPVVSESGGDETLYELRG